MKPLKALYIFLVNRTVINKTITFIVFYTVTGFAEGDIRLGIVAAYVVFKFLNPTRTVTGVFSTAAQEYRYIYGDRIKIAGETLNGIQVALPVSLPHIYVDIHSNDKMFGLQRSFIDIEKYNLEGDFGTSTTVYANLKDRIDVLIVLNPHTMRVLLDVSKHYDLEIINNSLMLYSRKKVYYSAQQSQQLVDAARAIIASLHPSLINAKLLNKHNTNVMKQASSDRLVKFKNYSVGSMRRLIALLIIFAVSVGFYFGMLSTYSESVTDSHIYSVMRIILASIWICVTFSIAYIGFSRKKIDITWS